MSEEIELLRCDHCGGLARTIRSNWSGAPTYYTQCQTCKLQTRVHYNRANVESEWNTRADPWRPIAEAKKDGTRLLLLFPKDQDGDEEYAIGASYGRGWVDPIDKEGPLDDREPTHFQPITPPKGVVIL